MDVYKQCCSQVAQLLIAQESESEPFKNKYSAAEQLCQCKAMVEGDTGTEITPTEKSLICAILDCRRGLTLLETDLLSDAETALESGLASLKHLSSDSDADYTALILEGSNGLAALWCNRDEFDKAKGFLDTANEMYSACQGCTDSCAVPDHLGGDDAATFAAKVEEQHTLTLFYLAQVYGHLGDKDKSAEFCGATLIRQLRTGGFDKDEWLQNCTQLAGYYLGEDNVVCAHYMFAAARALLEKEKAEGREIAEEVAANVSLGYAKYHMSRLTNAAELLGDSGAAAEPESSNGWIPEHLRFDGLDVPLSTNESVALPVDFAQARETFNKAMRSFGDAMAIYTADAWFTEHFDILMDISNLYRCLAVFEPDIHRKCVMHKQRIKGLEKSAEGMNQQIYKGPYRSALLEMGNTYRLIADLKSADGREPAKVAAAARKGIECMEGFVDSFKDEVTGGKRVDEDSEGYYVQAHFTLGSLYNKLQSVGKWTIQRATTLMHSGYHGLHVTPREIIQKAIKCNDSITNYVTTHNIESFRQEAELCSEMSALLKDKLTFAAR